MRYIDSQRVQFFFFCMVGLLLAFLFQGNRGIYSPDEGFYTSIAIQMLESGNFMIPVLGGAIWLDKPPLSLWGIAAGLRVFGMNEFGARAFTALCYFLTALLVYNLGRAMSTHSVGLLAAILYLTMLLPFIASNICTPDTPLVLFTTAAFYFFWMSHCTVTYSPVTWKLLFFIMIGLGFLTKGPAVLVPMCSIFCFLVIQTRKLKVVRLKWVLIGVFLFGIVGLTWYIHLAFRIPGSLAYFIDNQVWGRTISGKYSRNAGAIGSLIYIPTLLFGAFPWSFIWIAQWIRSPFRIHLRFPENSVKLFLLLWIGIPFLLFTAASSRLPLYILSIFPALALFIALSLQSTSQLKDIFSQHKITWRAHSTAVIIWIILLISLKGLSGYYPHNMDGRALFRAIQPHLPRYEYEVVSIDEHVDALSLYINSGVEMVTRSDYPYPFFIETEQLEAELSEISDSHEPFIFLTKPKSAMAICRFLDETHTPYLDYPLPYNRIMIVTE